MSKKKPSQPPKLKVITNKVEKKPRAIKPRFLPPDDTTIKKGDRREAITKRKLDKFLETLKEAGNVSASCEAAGLERGFVYSLLKIDPIFKKLWQESLDTAIDTMEQEAHRRAFKGTDKPVYQGGEQVGTIREYSDTLAIFLLKAHRPEKYRERFEHTGAGGGPVQVAHLLLIPRPLDNSNRKAIEEASNVIEVKAEEDEEK